MKVLNSAIFLLLFTACTPKPKYQVGECIYHQGTSSYFKVIEKNDKQYTLKKCEKRLLSQNAAGGAVIPAMDLETCFGSATTNMDFGDFEGKSGNVLIPVQCHEIK